MPTDLSCPTCKGTGWHPDRIARAGDPNTDPCPDCAGSGVAAWAVEAGAKAVYEDYAKELAAVKSRNPLMSEPWSWDDLPLTPKTKRRATEAVGLAAVREEAKKR